MVVSKGLPPSKREAETRPRVGRRFLVGRTRTQQHLHCCGSCSVAAALMASWHAIWRALHATGLFVRRPQAGRCRKKLARTRRDPEVRRQCDTHWSAGHVASLSKPVLSLFLVNWVVSFPLLARQNSLGPLLGRRAKWPLKIPTCCCSLPYLILTLEPSRGGQFDVVRESNDDRFLCSQLVLAHWIPTLWFVEQRCQRCVGGYIAVRMPCNAENSATMIS